MYLYKYNKNSFENIRTDIKIGDFSYPSCILAGIQNFQAKAENPNEIGMVGQSEWSFLSVDLRLYLSLSHFPFKSFH